MTETTEDRLLTGAEIAPIVAKHTGRPFVSATWRSYARYRRVPAPDDPGDLSQPANRRSPKWRESTVRAWLAGRDDTPGQGWRAGQGHAPRRPEGSGMYPRDWTALSLAADGQYVHRGNVGVREVDHGPKDPVIVRKTLEKLGPNGRGLLMIDDEERIVPTDAGWAALAELAAKAAEG